MNFFDLLQLFTEAPGSASAGSQLPQPIGPTQQQQPQQNVSAEPVPVSSFPRGARLLNKLNALLTKLLIANVLAHSILVVVTRTSAGDESFTSLLSAGVQDPFGLATTCGILPASHPMSRWSVYLAISSLAAVIYCTVFYGVCTLHWLCTSFSATPASADDQGPSIEAHKISKSLPKIELTVVPIENQTVDKNYESEPWIHARKTMTSFDYALSFGLRSAVLDSAVSYDLTQTLCNQHFKCGSTNQFCLQYHHHTTTFGFTSYARAGFSAIRKVFNLSASQYIRSICDGPLVPIGKSKGKSGANFLQTVDGSLFLKSMRPQEARKLEAILPAYFAYCSKEPYTLLTRVYGCVGISDHKCEVDAEHRKRKVSDKKVSDKQSQPSKPENYEEFLLTEAGIFPMDPEPEQQNGDLEDSFVDLSDPSTSSSSFERFFVMANALPPNPEGFILFDLKGSTQGRGGGLTEEQIAVSTLDENSKVLKDNDWKELMHSGLNIRRDMRAGLFSQLERDVRFLERQGLMDYSLFVGIRKNPNKTAVLIDIDPSGKSNTTAQEANGSMQGVRINGQGGETYCLAIIDILQTYDLSKKLETAIKSIPWKKKELSSVEPTEYAERFLAFMRSFVFSDEGFAAATETPKSNQN